MKNEVMTTEKLNSLPKDALIELYLGQAAALERMNAQMENQTKLLDMMQEQLRLLTQHR